MRAQRDQINAVSLDQISYLEPRAALLQHHLVRKHVQRLEAFQPRHALRAWLVLPIQFDGHRLHQNGSLRLRWRDVHHRQLGVKALSPRKCMQQGMLRRLGEVGCDQDVLNATRATTLGGMGPRASWEKI